MRIQSGKLCGISRITASRKGFKNGIRTIFTMGLFMSIYATVLRLNNFGKNWTPLHHY
jgi:hypothetical protein